MPTLLILGATSDIAQACAYRFAQENFSLLLAARNVERLEILQKDIQIKHQVDVHLFEFDACQFKTHADFYNSLPQKPDTVLVCFGYLGDHQKFGQDFNEAHKIININLTGTISISDIVANDLEKRQTGTLIGVSSVAGDRGRKGNYIYGATKAAYQTYLSGLRQRLFAKKVHVLDARPGFIATKMTADLNAPKALVAYPKTVANDIWKAYHKRKNVLYTPWFWFWIMLIIKLIPTPLFKRLSLR